MIYREHADMALSTIFAKVGEIGTPERSFVRDKEDFLQKATSQYHKSPIFADVFENRIEYKGNRKIYIPIRIDKMFFDFDHADKAVVEHDFNTVVDNLRKRGIRDSEMIKIWTTGKGNHLYVRLKSLNNPTKEEVLEYQRKMRALQFAVSTCGCNKTIHPLHSVDTKVFAEFSRMARMLGIPRSDNGLIPVAVDLKANIREWIRENRGWDALTEQGTDILKNWGWGRKSIHDIFKEEDEGFVRYPSKGRIDEISNLSIEPLLFRPLKDYTNHLTKVFHKAGFSPSLIDRTLSPYCDNDTRVAAGTKLLEKSFNPTMIANLFAMCNWHNFDYWTTFHYLEGLIPWKMNKQE